MLFLVVCGLVCFVLIASGLLLIFGGRVVVLFWTFCGCWYSVEFADAVAGFGFCCLTLVWLLY